MRHSDNLLRCAAVAFAFAFFAASSATAQQGLFGQPNISDLTAHPAEAPAIHSMVAQGVIRVVGEKFEPDAPMTRGDLAIATQHLFKLGRPAQIVEFTDIPRTSPLYSAVQSVAPFLGREALCFGCALISKFLPNVAVTRIESAVLLTNILVAHNKFKLLSRAEAERVLANVADAKTLKGPLRMYVATAIRNDILTLPAPNRLDPHMVQSRALTAVMLDRAQNKFAIPTVTPR